MASNLKHARESAEEKARRIHDRIDAFSTDGLRIFVTSSFQTHSIPLLHIISQCKDDVAIVFLNTGYLFPETLKFRDEVAANLGLHVKSLRSTVPKLEQRTTGGQLLFAVDTDRCCQINKVDVLEPILREYDVWISGVRADQSSSRSKLRMEQSGPHGVLRYHPMLDWSPQEIFVYRKSNDLPEHPLEQEGYLSIGCMPCTVCVGTLLDADPRGGRWLGQSKLECGLHTELAKESTNKS